MSKPKKTPTIAALSALPDKEVGRCGGKIQVKGPR